MFPLGARKKTLRGKKYTVYFLFPKYCEGQKCLQVAFFASLAVYCEISELFLQINLQFTYLLIVHTEISLYVLKIIYFRYLKFQVGQKFMQSDKNY